MNTQSHYFKEVLNKVGISLEYTESPNIFQKEQCLIIKSLQDELKNHARYPQNTLDFISGLKKFIKRPNWFKKSLMPSQLQRVTEQDITIGMKQESIFRLFLNIDCIQTEIITLLLQELMSQAISAEEDTIWIRLLLTPLRYLSYIKNSHKLATDLLETLEVATYPAQLETLSFIPEIIPDCEHDETAKELSKILSRTTDLTGAIIDCLNNLRLSPETKSDIQNPILAMLNSTGSLKTFSIIFSFLVRDCKAGNLPNILMKTRNALDTLIMAQSITHDSESDQLLTFEEIRLIAKSSKVVMEGWITVINSIRSAAEHKSVDAFILLLLHSTMTGSRKGSVEGIFKKKIKNKHFKPSFLESTLQKYLVPQILKDYIHSILDIAASLLRMHSDPSCFESAQIFYTVTFGHKYANKQHHVQILHSLFLFTGCGDRKQAIPALNILAEIARQHLKMLQPHTMQLMSLLDGLSDANLEEVKQIFDLLCSLIYGPHADESMDVFRGEMHMIVRKQLSSFEKSNKYKAIIAAIATVKNMAIVLDQSETIPVEESFSSIAELPTESSRQAATLLELAVNNTSDCPIAQGLYYDQLAQMVLTTESLDKYLMAWLFDVITNNFQNVYIADVSPESVDDIPVSVQYRLNSTKEMDAPITVNIAELTIKTKNNNAMLVFSPLFRLMRLVHHQQHAGNLTSINALLGCGIVLPDLDPDVGIDAFDSHQAKLVVDCIFHCINWFREIISAFVTQKDVRLRQRILDRLQHLVQLEELFTDSMKLIPDHKLPSSYFYNANLDSSATSLNSGYKAAERSKRKRAPNLNATSNLNLSKNTQSSQATSGGKPGRKPQSKEKESIVFQFREMDTDIILLLTYPLVVDEPTENQLFLNTAQFKFIMKDLVAKLSSVTKSKRTTIFTHLANVQPENLITDCVRLMPYVSKHLGKIVDEIKKLLEKSDGIHDAHQMFEKGAIDLKVSYELNLEMLSLVLGWPGFQNSKNLPLLRQCLRALIEEGSSQFNSAQELIKQFLKVLMAQTEYCLTLPCAVHLINIVQALCYVTTDETPKKKLVHLSGKLLSTRWFNLNGLPESGGTANLHIDALVKAHLHGSSVETISSIISWVQGECSELKAKDDHLTTFPSITKSNFPILYREACSTLLAALQESLHGLTNAEHLNVWHNIVTTLRSLMNIVKVQESRSNLSAFLKKSTAIVKVFLSHGLPILEIMLRSHATKVTEILKTLQQTTRFIHNLSCHSKVVKDNTLIAHVPQIRLTLETLLFRVKAALMANNCSAAFWMGNLRNKNLQGEEILSQSSENSLNEEQAEEDAEDELPPEDESENETMDTSTTDSKIDDDISDLV